ncbi:helix-turn-helix domain-containing protein [Olivibacter sitiensis]|uniref:helix-turn-helix domain-containing protein n=1 Tax=Olivibacter sitiensis TaxID=376470 RepID=UPI000485BA9E|nr:helix-turn-helix transcriptional regulator [Olivibacter sitiensis]
MQEESSENKPKKKRHRIPGATEELGKRLQERREELQLSTNDVESMTGFSKSTIIDMEQVKSTDINYYLEYAKTLDYPLPDLFNISIGIGPLFPLPPERQDRLQLTKSIRELHLEEDFFRTEKGTSKVIERLEEKGLISKKDDDLSSKVSSVLLGMVGNSLEVSTKKGRNNMYIKSKR